MDFLSSFQWVVIQCQPCWSYIQFHPPYPYPYPSKLANLLGLLKLFSYQKLGMESLTVMYLTQESPIQIRYFIPQWGFYITNWDTIPNWEYFLLVVYTLPKLLIRFYWPFITPSWTNKHCKSNNKVVCEGSHLGLYGQVLWPDPALVGLGPTRVGVWLSREISLSLFY